MFIVPKCFKTLWQAACFSRKNCRPKIHYCTVHVCVYKADKISNVTLWYETVVSLPDAVLPNTIFCIVVAERKVSEIEVTGSFVVEVMTDTVAVVGWSDVMDSVVVIGWSDVLDSVVVVGWSDVLDCIAVVGLFVTRVMLTVVSGSCVIDLVADIDGSDNLDTVADVIGSNALDTVVGIVGTDDLDSVVDVIGSDESDLIVDVVGSDNLDSVAAPIVTFIRHDVLHLDIADWSDAIGLVVVIGLSDALCLVDASGVPVIGAVLVTAVVWAAVDCTSAVRLLVDVVWVRFVNWPIVVLIMLITILSPGSDVGEP